MKRWTITVDILEGCDEFWEANPDYAAVMNLFMDGLLAENLLFENAKIVRFVDEP